MAGSDFMMRTGEASSAVRSTRQMVLMAASICRRQWQKRFMRIFHLSDLHIGLKLINRDLREDQEYILDQIIQKAAEKVPDAIVIAGDIYDKAVPSAEAVEVFDHFIGKLRNAVPDSVIMMISGNHDSAPRVNCFRSVLDRQKIYMIGMPPQTE